MSSGITDQSTTQGTSEALDKGKGKAAQPVEETEGETSEDEEMDEDGEVDGFHKLTKVTEEEDELAEIDTNNIITSGRRTRGKQIDFAKAAAEQPAAEEDSDDDGDFVAVDDGEKTDVEMA